MYRKNVAGQYIYFLLLDSAGAVVTGATVTARRGIDGAAQAACTGTITDMGNGQYRMNLSQADTNGDNIGYLFTATGAIPVHFACVMTAANPSDAAGFGLSRLDAAVTTRQVTFSLPANFAALAITAAGRVDVDAVAGTAQTARDLGAQLDAAVSTRMATYTQPTGFLAATFPGTVASPTNITAGTITTVSGNVTGSVGSVTGLNAALLDAAVSTRSTYAGADTAGTTTLLGRLSAGRAVALDNLDATVSSRSTYSGSDTPGTATLLSRLTAPRAASLDNLDVAVSTRMATGSVTLDTAGREAIADAILLRSIATGANGGRTVRDALRFLRNRWGVTTGTLTVYAEDDTTAAWTAPVTASPGADPITGIDPA